MKDLRPNFAKKREIDDPIHLGGGKKSRVLGLSVFRDVFPVGSSIHAAVFVLVGVDALPGGSADRTTPEAPSGGDRRAPQQAAPTL